MRRCSSWAAALITLLLSCSASAQDNVQGRVLDLVFPVMNLQMQRLDLVMKVEPVAGAARDLDVKETDTEIRIELAADVLFDFDKADIRPQAADALKQVADMIRDRKARTVRVEGHTDSKGSDSYNQKLSERRAAAVKDWLERKEGVKGPRYLVKGWGETKPVAQNEKPNGADDPEGRQKNRRVEIVIAKR